MAKSHSFAARWAAASLSIVAIAAACIGLDSSGPGEGTDGPLLQSLSPPHYDTARLGVGDAYYIDREHTITSLGPGLSDRLWIRTADDDKASAAASQISFTLVEEAVLVVGYDAGASSVPDWLANWTEAPADVDVTVPAPRSPLRLFYKTHAAGPVSLGGNLASGASGGRSMYVVMLLRLDELTPAAIAVSPSVAVLDPGATLQFSATLRDPLGRAVTNGPLEWTATGGNVDADGLYTAGSAPGQFQVTARSAVHGLTRAATVTIRDPGSTDVSPPEISGGQPTGSLAEGTTEVTMSVATDEAATCRWGSSSSTSFSDLGNTFTTTGGTAHSTRLAGLVDGQSYTRYVRCQDAHGNANGSSYAVTFSVAATSDVTPPVVSAGEPTGTLPGGTAEVELRVRTDEGAVCRSGTTATAAYSELPHTFTTTGGTAHATLLTGLVEGQSYTYYVRCRDAAGNANGASYAISFEVAVRSSAAITGVTFDWTTHQRAAPGSDNFPATWSADDHQYAIWGDGGGFGGTNSDGRVSLGVARIEGLHDSYVGVNRYGGKTSECTASINGKAHGAPLSLGSVLYMWVTPGSGPTGYSAFRLHRSIDKGCTWTPLSVEFTRATHGISYGGFVQFGRDNADARDAYVYTLAPEVTDASSLAIVQRPGRLMLLRVPGTALEDPTAYEFFAGRDAAGQPLWSDDQAARQPIFEDPDGTGPFPQMVRVPGLDRYVLTNQHGDGAGDEGFKSLLTMADAPEPWGPWTIFFRGAFFPTNEQTVFQWNFAPKWFRNGGRDFTLIFSGIQQNDSWNTVDGRFSIAP